jgi:hypothetical protein
MHWLFAFLLTQAIEIPIYLRPLRALSCRSSVWSRIALAFAASALTHPVVWFVLPAVWESWAPGAVSSSWTLYAVFLESFAVAGEALYLRLLGVPHPLRWSLLANGASFTAGLLSWCLFRWP